MKERTYCRVQFQNLLASYSLIAQRSARYNNAHLTGEEGIPCIYIVYTPSLAAAGCVCGRGWCGFQCTVSASYLLICQL